MASLSDHPRYIQARAWIFTHKAVSALIVIALVSGVYGTAHAGGAASKDPHYVIAAAALGAVSSSVSGTGQVSASDEVDLSAKSAGTITAVNVAPGDHVKAGQVLVATDATDDAFALENAQISLDRLTNPKPVDQQSAEAALTKATSDKASQLQSAIGSLAKGYADDDSVIAGLGDLLNINKGYLSSSNLLLSSTGRGFINTAFHSYSVAQSALEESEAANASIDNSSSEDAVKAALTNAAEAAKQVATAASDAQTAVSYVESQSSATSADASATARSTVSGLASTASGAATSLLSANSSLVSADTSLTNAQQALTDLTNPDTLDLRSAQLSVKQKQETYNDHFVTAPFDGIVGSVDAHVGDQSSGTLVTLVTTDEIAELSLNEVDAAKVAVGQKAALTFDAIDGLTIAGEVASIDAVGTVSSGVVNYGVKISFATDDPRVKPGMTVEAAITTARKDNVVAVPNAAIHAQGDADYILVIPGALAGAGGTAGITGTPQQVPVETGIAGDDSTEITSGLSAGDTYVARTITPTASAATSAAAARPAGTVTAPARATGAGAVRIQGGNTRFGG